MNAVVIGTGGREHALVKALAQSAAVTKIFAVPGSDGMASEPSGKVIATRTDWRDFSRLEKLVLDEAVSFVLIGPEVPLVDGLADRLRAIGVAVVGPSAEAARLEGSKIYSKEFMIEAGVPTARSFTVTSIGEALAGAAHFAPPYVLKADGLAAGKGVFICKDLAELEVAATSLFVDKSMGDAGLSALLEEFQPGYEISYLVLTNGSSYEPLVLAQDHKRLRDNDQGPNTGGMGVVAPIEIDAGLRAQINSTIVEPTLREIQRRGLLYRGILYIGLMITPTGPSVIEYNARFGDPETQVILPLLDGDWASVFMKLAHGDLVPLRWRKAAAACVVLAAEGYPDAPVNGAEISGLDMAKVGVGGYVLHAGTIRQGDGSWKTAGGRVLNVIGLGSDLPAALWEAYRLADGLLWKGLQKRMDIGGRQG